MGSLNSKGQTVTSQVSVQVPLRGRTERNSQLLGPTCADPGSGGLGRGLLETPGCAVRWRLPDVTPSTSPHAQSSGDPQFSRNPYRLVGGGEVPSWRSLPSQGPRQGPEMGEWDL